MSGLLILNIELIVLVILFIFTVVNIVEFFIDLKEDLGKLFSYYPSKSLTIFIAAARRINAAMIGKSFPSHFCIEYDAFCNRRAKCYNKRRRNGDENLYLRADSVYDA